MRTPCCHSFVAFMLKFLNFLQTFLGVTMIIYSVYMLNRWQRHNNDIDSMKFLFNVVLNSHNGLNPDFMMSLPAPWFIYAFMGVGILICCVTCIGHFAAETINSCCLCFYALLITVFILFEISLVVFIAFDRHWEKDLPLDPTGELDSMRTFIKHNLDIFAWVGIAIAVMQALSLLFATILRSLISSSRDDEDGLEEDYDFRRRTREPLFHSYSSKASGSPSGDSDIWNSRMRDKYGLNGGDGKHHLLDQNSSTDLRR